MSSSVRPVLIGQAPGKNGDPSLPLFPVPSHMAGGRLCTIMGLTRRQYLDTFERTNLVPFFPGSEAKGDKFPMSAARASADVLRPLLVERHVFLVGKNVAKAFRFDGLPFFQDNEVLLVRGSRRSMLTIIPHPSGVSRWYNNPANMKRAKQYWSGFLADKISAQ